MLATSQDWPGVLETPQTVLEKPAMATTSPTHKSRTDPDHSERDRRALSQYLTVLEDVGRVRDADGLFLGVSQSGSEYLVDMREGACECDDHRYRGIKCKHARRVEFATGMRPVPGDVDVQVDPQLGEHVVSPPRLAMPDGGIVATDAGDVDVDDLDAEPERDNADAECECEPGDELECFACYMRGGA